MSRSIFTAASVTVALATALSCTSCSGGGSSNKLSLKITANPNPVPILSNMTFTTITVTGTNADGTPFEDGLSPAPDIKTDYGSLGAVGDGTAADDTQDYPDGMVSGHAITVQLYADATVPANGAPAHVTANYVDPYGNTVNAEADVTFTTGGATGPTCTPQANPAGCVTRVESLSFSCKSYNLGALTSLANMQEEPCNAVGTDSLQNEVDGTLISYKAEAGTMTYDSDNNFLAYYPNDPNAVHTMPRDVDPTDLDGYMGHGPSAETACCSRTNNVNNTTVNARDGLVTIIAWVTADPAAVMAQPAPFNGEPFVDANDNGVFDDGMSAGSVGPAEDYVDLNGNGKYDGPTAANPNGAQDPTKPMALWKQLKVLWTGQLQSLLPVVAVTPPTVDIPYMQNAEFTFAFVDQNYNVLAANDTVNDGVTWQVMPTPDISLGVSPSTGVQDPSQQFFDADDPNHFGMALDDNFNFIDPSNPANWLINAYFTVWVEDTYMCKTPLVSENFTVNAAVSRNLFLDNNGMPTTDYEEMSTSGGGTLEPPPAATCASD